MEQSNVIFHTEVVKNVLHKLFMFHRVRIGGFLFQREKYVGERNEDDMLSFVLSRLQVTVVKVDDKMWEHDHGSSSWLLVLCWAEDGTCPDTSTRLKLAALLVILSQYQASSYIDSYTAIQYQACSYINSYTAILFSVGY